MIFPASIPWHLPQYLFGQLLKLILKKRIIEKRSYKDTNVFIIDGKFTGVSLGPMIFVNTQHSNIDQVIKHEYGHFKQSIYFGWLYLIIIGLPSITMNILTRMKILKAKNYYKRWPENWADKLGKVER